MIPILGLSFQIHLCNSTASEKVTGSKVQRKTVLCIIICYLAFWENIYLFVKWKILTFCFLFLFLKCNLQIISFKPSKPFWMFERPCLLVYETSHHEPKDLYVISFIWLFNQNYVQFAVTRKWLNWVRYIFVYTGSWFFTRKWLNWSFIKGSSIRE